MLYIRNLRFAQRGDATMTVTIVSERIVNPQFRQIKARHEP
jgi:hypothetical protein